MFLHYEKGPHDTFLQHGVPESQPLSPQQEQHAEETRAKCKSPPAVTPAAVLEHLGQALS